MTVTALFGQTVTIERRAVSGSEDSHGNRVRSWSEVAAAVPARIRVNTGRELVGDTVVTFRSWVAYFAGNVDIRDEDRVLYNDGNRDLVLSVVAVASQPHPSGAISHHKVTLEDST